MKIKCSCCAKNVKLGAACTNNCNADYLISKDGINWYQTYKISGKIGE